MNFKLAWQIVGVALLIAFFVWAVRDFRKFDAKRQRVFREGLRGEGTIVGATDGLARRGYDREVVLTLDVVLPGRPPFRAEARVFAGQVKARELVQGARLPVLVDPVDSARVVVDPSTGLRTSELSIPR